MSAQGDISVRSKHCFLGQQSSAWIIDAVLSKETKSLTRSKYLRNNCYCRQNHLACHYMYGKPYDFLCNKNDLFHILTFTCMWSKWKLRIPVVILNCGLRSLWCINSLCQWCAGVCEGHTDQCVSFEWALWHCVAASL